MGNRGRFYLYKYPELWRDHKVIKYVKGPKYLSRVNGVTIPVIGINVN